MNLQGLQQAPILTIHCKICAIRINQYTDIVVEDLERNYDDDYKYVTVVKLPNWEQGRSLHEDDEGYLQFVSVEAGKTFWFNRELKDYEVHKYSNNYFLNFFKKKDVCLKDKFKFE